jgi:FO synthase
MTFARSSVWAVVPVKRFARAKTRLSLLLTPTERATLARAMFEDMLDALGRCETLTGILVVTQDEQASAIADAAGAHVLQQDAHGLNAAVAAGCAFVQTLDPTNAALVVPSDIPHLSHLTIGAAVRKLQAPSTALLQRAKRDGGTNLFGCNPAAALRPQFGPASFERHRDQAKANGLQLKSAGEPTLAIDLDEPQDLQAFITLNSETRTHALLHSWNITARMRKDAEAHPPASQRGTVASTRRHAHKTLRPEQRLSHDEALALADCNDLDALMQAAAKRRDARHGSLVTYSRKVFIPLTRLCRDVCHYCTFAQPPRKGERAYLSIDEVLAIARAGAAAGCKEALFTLGDKPELRYRAAREELAALGHPSTLSYLAEAARRVLDETGLFPHLNPGLMNAADLEVLRGVSLSMGIMLESTAERLCARGMPHHGSPDKHPAARLQTMRLAGEMRIPFTSGLLIGIGETRRERIEALMALRDLHDAHGHIQEIIIQNFRPKPDTRMANAPAAGLEDHLWTVAAARLIFDPDMNIQAPPNLSGGNLRALVDAGINDWGGVSPVTPDHVNPEAPWPHLAILQRATEAAGKHLTERLAIYPSYARDLPRWVDPKLHTRVLHSIDAGGWPRTDHWSPGSLQPLPDNAARALARPAVARSHVGPIIAGAERGHTLREPDIVTLFEARGDDFAAVCTAADALREDVSGDAISYVITRNINYTNICGYRCQFCAFSKGKTAENLRGRPYDLPLDEIAERTRQAYLRGATEVCMQGGIHPDYTGNTYLDICRTVKAAVPDMHVHAFSPLEVHHGAQTLKLSVCEFLQELRAQGLGSLPGTAAEILDDEVRAIICPDKINTAQWLSIMSAAHEVGLRSTATIMFGHVDRYEHWARHLLRLRDLQAETGGFTEFVPLPFVHMEAPIYLKGRARKGPTFREAVLMHAVARLALHPLIPNIQTSWVKMGRDGVETCLRAGANDLGGTLMDETITRSAGAQHGQEMTPQDMERIIRGLGRIPRQRTTIYGDAPGRPPRVDLPTQGRATSPLLS